MIRVRAALLAAVALLGLTSCSVVTRSGQPETRSRPVSGFTAVDLRGAGEVTIRQTGRESLTIEADRRVLPALSSTVSGGTLHLGTRPRTILIDRPPVRYRVTVARLSELSISGSGTITATGLTGPELRVRISGSGTARPAGRAARQQVSISGSGSYQGSDLAGRSADVSISGSGDAWVAVTDSLRARISGSGTLYYRGRPRISQQISGSGRLIHR